MSVCFCVTCILLASRFTALANIYIYIYIYIRTSLQFYTECDLWDLLAVASDE